MEAPMSAASSAVFEPLIQPHTLDFKIPEWRQKQLIQAQTAIKGKIFWTTDWYLNNAGKPVSISYADNIEDSNTLAKRFIDEPVLGFDMEWKCEFGKTFDGLKDNVSLIQLARDGEVGLFHIARHKGTTTAELFAPTLLEIIRSKSVLKTGVAIYSADARQLRTFAGIEAKGLFELSHLYRLLEHARKDGNHDKKVLGKMVGLSRQVQMHLKYPLAKGKVRTSDWTQPLTEAQRKYAAADSYAGLVLYHIMNSKRLKLDPVPPLPGCVGKPKPQEDAAEALAKKLESAERAAARKNASARAEETSSPDNAFETSKDEPKV
jgi:hypothetical protein